MELFCPWCQDEFEDDIFCRTCGHPVALKAQPAVQVMLQTGAINEDFINTAQRRLISKVLQAHRSEIMQGMVKSSMEEDSEFASEERERMLEQNESLTERFDQFKNEADEGHYAPERYLDP